MFEEQNIYSDTVFGINEGHTAKLEVAITVIPQEENPLYCC
jgi:hypothetical protein